MALPSAITLYRSLLKLAASPVLSQLAQEHVRGMVRTRFRVGAVLMGKKDIARGLSEARQAHRRILAAVHGDASKLQWVEDLSTGKRGRLKHVLENLSKRPRVDDGTMPRQSQDYRSFGERKVLGHGIKEHSFLRRRKDICSGKHHRNELVKRSMALPVPTELLTDPKRFGWRFVTKDGERIPPPLDHEKKPKAIKWRGLTTWKDKTGSVVLGCWPEHPYAHLNWAESGPTFYRVRGRRQSSRLGAAIKNRILRKQALLDSVESKKS